jgi:hypothetical protein
LCIILNIVCVFCSSISSMLNSLSAVTWEDFLKLKFSKVSDERATVVTKCLGKFTTSGLTIASYYPVGRLTFFFLEK